MVLKEKFVVSAPGCEAGEPMRHDTKDSAAKDMRHLEEQGYTPKLETILVPVTSNTVMWGGAA